MSKALFILRKGATASNVHARPFGLGDASVSVHTTTDGSIVISASGSTDVSHLTWFARNPYFDPVAKHMSGMLPFVSTVVVKRARRDCFGTLFASGSRN